MNASDRVGDGSGGGPPSAADGRAEVSACDDTVTDRVERVDVVVVGGGAAGAVVAARLGADAGRRVLLLEAGTAPGSGAEYPAELRDAGSLRGADPGHPDVWEYPAVLAEGRPYSVVRGRILGGSTAVNGAYFARARRADFDRWAAAGLPGWGYDACLPAMRALEADADFGASPLHGGSGPMPVRRPALDAATPHPVSTAFAEAAEALGVPREPDKNGEQPEGYGPLPQNVLPRPGGGYDRWNTARAYLLDAARLEGGQFEDGRPEDDRVEDVRPEGARLEGGQVVGRRVDGDAADWAGSDGGSLEVRGGARVMRVLFEGTRAVGVEVERGGVRSRVRAGIVVLAAGAIGTAQLLLRSGIGPREELERHAIPVVVEAPGVGTAFSDHPQFALPWHPRPGALRETGTLFDSVLNTTLALEAPHAGETAEVELLPMLRGLRSALGSTSGATSDELPVAPAASSASRVAADHEGDDPVLLVGLQNPEARGRLRLAVADPDGAPELEYHYLATALDRARARAAVRFALALLERPEFAAVSTGHDGPAPAVLADDDALDAWVLAHLGTAQHLSGTAPMGADDDPRAVADARGAVHGTTALHLADLALLPTVPSRGPAATAVLIGERIATSLRTDA